MTDLAVDILQNPNPDEQQAAIRNAALGPAIHREIWEKYGSGLPSDANLAWELTRDRGFTQTGASEFIPEYRDTIAFAKLAEAATVEPQTEGVDRGNGGGEAQEQSAHDSPPEQHRQRRRRMTGDESVLTIPLVGGSSIAIEGGFPISEQDWTQFMTVLEAMKPGLVSDEEDADQQEV